MDIPLFRDFGIQRRIDIHTPAGIVQLAPIAWRRGLGAAKWHLAIDGICMKEVEAYKEYHVTFRGDELYGHFTKLNQSGKGWVGTYETILAKPGFWGEIE